MKSPKILLFMIILSLVLASGFMPGMAASASPAIDGWTVDPTVKTGSNTQPVKAESMDVAKLPASKPLSSAEKSALQKLIPPLDLPVDSATFTQMKTDAAKNQVANSAKAQKFSVKNSAQSKPGLGFSSPATTSGLTANYAPAVIDNFAGPSMGGYYPADASIAVGPTSMIACVNASVVGYDKTGLVLYNTPMTTWWSSALRSGYSLIFNPVCKYDKLGGRFIIVAALENASPLVSKYLVSVSQTSGNNAGWYNYAFDATIDGVTSSSFFAAFPDVGVDNNAVYITSNQYTASTQAFQYAKIRVFQKSLLYAGTIPGWTDFWNFTNVTTAKRSYAVRAALSLDPTNYEYFADSESNGGSQLTLFRIVSSNPWTTPVFSIASKNTPTTTYSLPPNALQYDSTYVRVPTGDNRLLNLILENGSLWTAHTIAGTSGSTSVAAVRWYQVDPVGAAVIQEGTFVDGDDYSYFYPVVAVDSLGDMGINYNWSGPGDFVSIAFTGRLSTDTAGIMEYPQYYFADGVRANTSGRWGAYGGAATDPVSSKMWFIHQIPGTSITSWATDIYSSEFAVAQPFNKTAPTDGATNQPVSNMLAWSASTGADNYQYCIDTTNDSACNWAAATTTNSTSATLSLLPSTTYYWQVRAVAGVNYTYADGSATAFRRFTTGPLPVAFSKTSPTNASTGQLIAPTLTWAASSGATSYDYCYATTSTGCTSSSGTWTNVGNNTNSSSVPVSGLASATVYYWQVRANNSVGSVYANTNTAWTFTTGSLAGAFNKTLPSNAATDQPLSITLQWSSSTGATGYQYCYSTSASACTSAGGGSWLNTATTSVVIPGLSQSTTYYWHVRVVNGIGTTWSNSNTVWTFTTGTAPAAFNKFSPPSDASTHQALTQTLSWGSSAGATSYQYCYTTTVNGCSDVLGTWIGNGTTTSVLLPVTLAEGTTYYWQVRAVSNIATVYAGPTPAADWSFTTGSLPNNFAKTAPIANATNQSGDLTLSWGGSGSAAGDGSLSYQYCLYTSTASDCNPGTINWVSVGGTTSASLTDLVGSTAYHWQVRAQNNIGYKYADTVTFSTFYTFTTGAYPGAFAKSSPSNAATSQQIKPTLSWGISANVSSYQYCYATTDICNKGGAGSWVGNGTTTSITLPTLAEGTTYFWQVRAINGIGITYANSSATSWTFTTGYLPVAFGKTSPASGAPTQPLTPTLNWNTSSGATSYEYCYGTSNTCSSSGGTWISSGTNNFVTLGTALSQGTQYFWHVRANNSIGTRYSDGSDLSTWSFTTGTLPGGFTKGLTPANNATNQPLSVTLNWGSSSGGSGTTTYEYCYTTSANCGAGTWINVGTSTNATISGLTESTPYHWQVRAVNVIGSTYADGGSASTVNWAFTTGTLPAAFNKTTPSDASTGASVTPTLTWATSLGTTTFEYCYSLSASDCTSSGGGSWTSTGTNTNVTLPTLTENTKYYWHVRANNSIGTRYSNADSQYSFTTGFLPGAFIKDSPADNAPNMLLGPTLSWFASSSSNGAITYEYCINTGNTCSSSGGTWVSATTNLSVTLSGLSQLTDYYWQVRATNNTGTTYANGLDTATRKFTTGKAPDAFNKSAPGDGVTGQTSSLSLSWATANGATKYEYCYTTAANCNAATWVDAGTATTANLTGLGTPGLATTYHWQVRASNDIGPTYANSGAEFTFQVGALPGTFSLNAPANGATNQLLAPSLSWGTSAGSTSYSYCYSTTSTDCSNSGVGGTWTVHASPVTLPTLLEGTTYYWNAKADNTYGTTYGSATPRSFTTGSMPTAFNKSTPSNGAIDQLVQPQLTWSASTNAASYDYCVSLTNNTCATWVSAGTNTSVTLPSALTGGTTYYWQVRANSGAGTVYADGGTPTSVYYSFTTGTPPGAFNHSAPANSATALATRGTTLTWTASAGATSYDYCYVTGPNCNSGPWINVGNTTSVVLDNLTSNKTYHWQVRATNGFGTSYAEGAIATVWQFKTATAAVPGAPKKSTPANGAAGQATSLNLTWTAGTGTTTAYQYCYTTTYNGCTNTTGPWQGNGTATTVAISSLSQSTTYYWQVRAQNAIGTVYADDVNYDWSFTTTGPTSPFGKATLTDGTTNAALMPTLTWGASTNAATYDYCVSLTNNSCTTWTTGVTGTSVTLATALLPNTTYYWQVRAVGGTTTYADGGSDTSGYWSFTTATFVKIAPANNATNVCDTGSCAGPNPGTRAVNLTWSADPGATAYFYCIDTTAAACGTGGSGTWVNVGTSTTFQVTLAKNLQYYWHVRATDGSGTTYTDGADSSVYTFKTKG